VSADDERGTEVRYHHSSSLPSVLEDAGCALLVSTYQAGQLVAIGVADGRLSFSFRRFDNAMGVAVGEDRLVVGGKNQVWTLVTTPTWRLRSHRPAPTTGAGCRGRRS